MKYILEKKFYFEASHRLIKNYTGKCSNIHGHTFEVILRLESNCLNDQDMVIDFYDTLPLKKWIDENLDHSLMIWEKDDLLSLFENNKQKLFICAKNPTSEYIAEVILKKAIEIFEGNYNNIKVHSITINETSTSGITIYP